MASAVLLSEPKLPRGPCNPANPKAGRRMKCCKWRWRWSVIMHRRANKTMAIVSKEIEKFDPWNKGNDKRHAHTTHQHLLFLRWQCPAIVEFVSSEHVSLNCKQPRLRVQIHHPEWARGVVKALLNHGRKSVSDPYKASPVKECSVLNGPSLMASKSANDVCPTLSICRLPSAW